MFKDWLKNDEMTRVNGGIKSPTAYPGFAEYLVNTPAGQRNFVLCFPKPMTLCTSICWVPVATEWT
jgi:hypothetical protein